MSMRCWSLSLLLFLSVFDPIPFKCIREYGGISFWRAEAAHSRRRVVMRSLPSTTPRYDRSITTFDPSGRLLQVEYALQASSRGSSVLVAMEQNGSAIYIIVSGSASNKPVLLSSSTSLSASVNDNSFNKVFRIDDHLWLVTAGLVGDALALASHLRTFCQRHRFAMGEALRVEQAARQATALQHELTRTGGARPLGCTAMIVGIDTLPSKKSNMDTTMQKSYLKIFRADPGGIIEDCLYFAGGKGQEKLLTKMSALYEVDGNDKTVEDNDVKTDPRVFVSKLINIINQVSVEKSYLVDVWVLRPNTRMRGNVETLKFANLLISATPFDLRFFDAFLQHE